MSRVRRLLAAKVAQVADDVADLTAAIAVNADAALIRARASAMAHQVELNAALRDFDERHEDPDRTPVRTASQQMRAAGAGAGAAFRNAGDIASGRKPT